MTESANKKSKEGRYRVDSSIIEMEPDIEPLNDLDNDEDAIDRLLINTGFDIEEDYSAFNSMDVIALDEHLVAHDNPAFEFGELGDEELIEPLDIDSPITDSELMSKPFRNEATLTSSEPIITGDDPVSAEDDGFWTVQNHADEIDNLGDENFSLPAVADEEVEPIDLGSAIVEFNETEAPDIENAEQENPHGLFEEPSTALIDLEPEPYPVWKNAIDDADPFTSHAEATEVNAGGAPLIDTATLEKDIHPEIPVPPVDWNRLLSKQEDIARQLTSLDSKARNTARLSYSALALAVTALCTALAAGYLNVQIRSEQTRLKDMTAMLEEDMKGLNEIFESNAHSVEGNAEKPSHFSDPVSKPEEKAITAEVTPSEAPEPKQAAAVLSLTPAIINKKPSVPPVHKTPLQTHKPALIKAHTKPSARASVSANQTGAYWTVNLASFRQKEDATKKAVELRQKGIPVKVIKVDVNRATWYRLTVPGFKTKEAASTHSTRLKKMLHQNSIWVAAI